MNIVRNIHHTTYTKSKGAQVSVAGLVLFDVLINDLEREVNNEVAKSADDSVSKNLRRLRSTSGRTNKLNE